MNKRSVSVLHKIMLIMLTATLLAPGGVARAASPPSRDGRGVIFGPTDGTLYHSSKNAVVFESNVSVSDFWATVDFTNPYSTDKSAWDFGIAFRGQNGSWMLLSITSNREWILMCKDASGYNYPYRGPVDNLDTSPSGKNTLQLDAEGSTGRLLVNNKLISNLDLSCTSGTGDVSLMVGWHFKGIDGEKTSFRYFTVGQTGSAANNSSSSTDSSTVDENPGDSSANTDSDNDQILDKNEQWFAETYMPIFYYDEQEYNILTDVVLGNFDQLQGVFFLHQVSIADCGYITDVDSGEHSPTYASDKNPFGAGYALPKSVLLSVLEVFPYDFLPYDPKYDESMEEDIFVHYGDIEPIRVCLRDDDRDGAYQIEMIHIRRHKHDYVYMPWKVEMEGLHPRIYVSEGKHGTYFSEKECENAVPWWQVWAWDEDCGGGKRIVPFTGPEFNVGEAYKNKSATLWEMGMGGYFKRVARTVGSNFVDEYVWSAKTNDKSNRQNYFCGGVDVTKFSGTHSIITGYSDNNCAPGMTFKWWPYFAMNME